MADSSPMVVKEFKKSFLFGLISIYYFVEDRRPDLEEYSGKYKHYLYVNIFRKTYHWLFRTEYLYEDNPFVKPRNAIYSGD